MPSLKEARSINASFTSSYRPTAVFVGGTSGIGEGMVRAFARATEGRAHIIIVGRNQESAEKIIASFPQTPESTYEFVQCDASLMKNVVAAATDIKSRVMTLNYLITCQGVVHMRGNEPTSEGIDTKLALHFYSRWKFLEELLPCLEKAKEAGQEARFISVLAAGQGAPLEVDNLGLKKNFSVLGALQHAATYNDLMVSEYSKRYPNMSFIHIRPGFVNTPAFYNLHWVVRFLAPILYFAATSVEDGGEYMLCPLISPAYKQGGFHLDQHGDPVPAETVHVTDEARSILVDHYRSEVAV